MDGALHEVADLDKIHITFDLKRAQIEIKSAAETLAGKPLLEWSVDTKSGDVKEIKRNAKT